MTETTQRFLEGGKHREKLQGQTKRGYKQVLQMIDMFIIFDDVYDFLFMPYTYVINTSLYTLNICSL